jgi:hypothetical protein
MYGLDKEYFKKENDIYLEFAKVLENLCPNKVQNEYDLIK